SPSSASPRRAPDPPPLLSSLPPPPPPPPPSPPPRPHLPARPRPRGRLRGALPRRRGRGGRRRRLHLVLRRPHLGGRLGAALAPQGPHRALPRRAPRLHHLHPLHASLLR